MAKLYFYYASMNAGKSSTLLQAAFNYGERGMTVMLWTAAIDDRLGFGAISSRIGLAGNASRFESSTDIEKAVLAQHQETPLAPLVPIPYLSFGTPPALLRTGQLGQIGALCSKRLRLLVACSRRCRS